MRLALRPWRVTDAPAALEIYGHDDVARWLSPAMDRVHDVAATRRRQCAAEDATTVRKNGMHRVCETGKYHGQDLQVFRPQRGDLNASAPAGHHPPKFD